MTFKFKVNISTHEVPPGSTPPQEGVHITRFQESNTIPLPPGYAQMPPEKQRAWQEWMKVAEEWMAKELMQTPPGWELWSEEQQKAWLHARTAQLTEQLRASYTTA